jgi:redox-sensitive bicupin YhaK (pirin superfamily)
MISIRPAEARGAANFGWLDSRHTFSFGDYHDPDHMGFGPLRAINEDRVSPGAGFNTHAHRDMEIVSYVLEGALEHKDSIGTGSVIRPGDVQRMSAGTGIRHSEFNHSQNEPVHFLQIWLLPESAGIAPAYEQKSFTRADKQGALRLILSHDGRDGSVRIHQDADVYASIPGVGNTITFALAPKRQAWVQVARGTAKLDGQTLKAGDGAAITDQASIAITAASDDTEFLLFDLA